MERRETFRKLRMRENFSKAFEGYFQWISKAGRKCNNISQFRNTSLCTKSVFVFNFAYYYITNFISKNIDKHTIKIKCKHIKLLAFVEG